MLWDGLIILVLIALGVAGWNVGIINSWRGPFAIVIATLITQHFYVDFSTFIVQQLRLSPEMAVAVGYVLMWGAIEIICEILMSVVLPFGSKNKPTFFERGAGAIVGLVKALVVVLLPAIALQAPITVPHAPPDKAPLINPVESGVDKSALLPIFDGIGKGLYPSLGNIVASSKQPSFKPNFDNDQDSGSSK